MIEVESGAGEDGRRVAAGTEALARLGNPQRVRRLIRSTVDRIRLDLHGLTVLTEAGSGAYALTPAIALAAGADEVIAVSRDSQYGSAAGNLAAAAAAAELFAAGGRLTPVVGRPGVQEIARADIITNLGFLRPIDAAVIASAKPTAAVPLMCEAWEWRPGDIDLGACRARGLPVLGTNEDADGVRVFDFSGPLAGRLLFDAGFEVLESSVVVLSPDRFGGVIARWLERAGARVHLCASLASEASRAALAAADVLLVADYGRPGDVVAADGVISPDELARIAPAVSVVQFAGGLDAAGLGRVGIPVHPPLPVPPIRMARTLAHVGIRPVVGLHAAGLRVGELACRARLAGHDVADVERTLDAEHELVQIVTAGPRA